MSLDVLNQVWTAEMAFLSDMYLLDADFFRFVWGLLQQREAAAPTTVALAAHAGTKASLAFLVWTYCFRFLLLFVVCCYCCCCCLGKTNKRSADCMLTFYGGTAIYPCSPDPAPPGRFECFP